MLQLLRNTLIKHALEKSLLQGEEEGDRAENGSRPVEKITRPWRGQMLTGGSGSCKPAQASAQLAASRSKQALGLHGNEALAQKPCPAIICSLKRRNPSNSTQLERFRARPKDVTAAGEAGQSGPTWAARHVQLRTAVSTSGGSCTAADEHVLSAVGEGAASWRSESRETGLLTAGNGMGQKC